MSLFVVVKEPEKFSPWAIKHTPTGGYAGTFVYRARAKACCAAYNDLHAETDLTTVEACMKHMQRLVAVRRPFVEADGVQYAARHAKRERR
jgi:hypothetical protein